MPSDVERPASLPPVEAASALHVLRVTLPAAPTPLVLRRDRTPGVPGPGLDPADVLRYVGAARRTLRGPLVAALEGPGDPLASAAHVLRALALLREHDPDVMTGLVVDGPLVAEYLDELLELGLHHVVLRMDAMSVKAAWRVYGRVVYRGDVLVGPDAGRLVLEEGRRAVRLLVAARVPVAIRFTAIPTVNTADLPAVAAFAAAEGVERVDVVPHRPAPRAPLARAGVPTEGELAHGRDVVAAAYRAASADGLPHARGALSWLSDGRLRDVALADLEHVDPLSLLPGIDPEGPEAAPILPPRKSRVVAVATSDGAFVDRSFVDAAHVHVYAVGETKTRWLGTRTMPTGILRRRDGVGVPRELLAVVAGCHAVVATRFTKKAAVLLDAVGIRPMTAGGHVEDVLDRVARGTLRAVDDDAPPPPSDDRVDSIF
ncbi:MAG: radical SAM protein [Planctomycetes bacterium]|nr:radical SAM protein [Planctomycetota bacterium]